MSSLGRALGSVRARLAARIDPTAATLGGRIDELAARVQGIEGRPGHLEAIAPVMAWIAQATLTRRPQVSVIVPTRNRASSLRRAIDSVVAQTYPEWELLIADDHSDDETPELIASLQDPRIRSVRPPSRGAGAARNAALEVAEGELIAYVDDDNALHPGWLKSVVWAFEQRPDCDVLYGAFIVDDVRRLLCVGSESWPGISLNPYDYDALTERALTDISATAHRAGLSEARFDEALGRAEDWDLLGRLTADKPPLVLPAIASYYYTDREDRLSASPLEPAEAERVRSKLRRVRVAGGRR